MYSLLQQGSLSREVIQIFIVKQYIDKGGVSISNKASDDDIKKECERRNLIFKGSFIKKNDTWVNFQCPVHLDKGIIQTKYYRLKHNKYGCKYCSGKENNTDDFKKKMAVRVPTITVLGDYQNANTPITCQCNKCGYTWEANVRSLLNGSACPKCRYIIIQQKKRKTHEQFVQQMQELHPNLTVLSEYKGDRIKVKCYCNIHKITFDNTPGRLIQNDYLCPKCVSEYRSKSQALSQTDFENRIKQTQPNVLVLSKYKNSNSYIEVKCLVHNQMYKQLASSLLAGKCGCDKCIGSKGERLISKILSERQIKYLAQYSFDNCRNIAPLKYDFYLPDYNCCIEYQGVQHYKPVQFGGISIENAQKKFDEATLRDRIKVEYCAKNNIKLLCIPYWEYDNLEQYLDEHLFKGIV